MPGTTAASSAVDPRWRRLPVALASVALLAGVILRFAAQSAMWLDEALTVHLAQLDLGDIGEALRHDGHPPLYYVLLKGWMGVFGDSDAAVRALSGVISLATLPLAFLLGRRLGGARAGWICMLVLATSPYAVRYANENRMYALVSLFSIGLWLAILRYRDRRSTAMLATIGLLAGALLWTHYWGAFLLVGVTLVLTGEGLVEGRIRAMVAPVAAMMAGSLLFLPWVPSLLDQLRDTGTPWATPRNPFTAASLTLSDLSGGTARSESVPLAALLILGIVLALFAGRSIGSRIELDFRRLDPAWPIVAIVFSSLGVGVVLAWLSGTAYESRYAAIIAPFVAVLVGVGLAKLPDGGVRTSVVAVVCVLGLVGAVRSDAEDRTQADEAAGAIRERGSSGDLVVACPDQLGPGILRELDGRFEVVAYPLLESAERVDWVDYEERHAAADPDLVADALVARAEGDIWIVWRGGYRTLGDHCERLVAALTVRTNGVERVVNDREVFEPSIVDRALLR